MSMLVVFYLWLMSLNALYLYRVVALSVYAQMKPWEQPAIVTEHDLPMVTVQLPLHNEKAVVHRLLDAVCALEYPAEKLQIQVLDDSTDATSELILSCVRAWQARGVRIEYLRRPVNQGYKAGNLAFGMHRAQGEYIAIFDADFVPESGWLLRALAHFFAPENKNLGLVQTRWGHLNADQSMLTYAEKLIVDHYSITQATRTRLGLWSSFYGSAGLWRRTCIEQAGGWSGETLTEDLHLAYLAQLAGWRIGFEDALLVRAELPNSIIAYKNQQFRWAKGNMQVMRLLWRDLYSAPTSLFSRLDAMLFATWSVSHLLSMLIFTVRLFLILWPSSLTVYLDGLVTLGLIAMLLPVVIAAFRRQFYFPLHIVLGTGISLNNVGGMFVGLFGAMGGVFHATPKGSDEGHAKEFGLHWSTHGEVLLTILAVAALVKCIQAGWWLAIPLFLLNALGYGWVAAMSLQQTLQSWVRYNPYLLHALKQRNSDQRFK